MVGAAQRGAAVRDHQAGRALGLSKTRSHSVRSVSTSSALERSSNTSSSGSRTNMRAAAVRWICPPESLTPFGPTLVSRPCSNSRRSSSITARSHRAADVVVALVQAHQDVVAQRVAEQARHLGGVGAARRGEELAGSVHRLCHSSGSRPRLCGSSPSSTRSRVVLPEPIRPVTTVNEPRCRFRLIPAMPFSDDREAVAQIAQPPNGSGRLAASCWG